MIRAALQRRAVVLPVILILRQIGLEVQRAAGRRATRGADIEWSIADRLL